VAERGGLFFTSSISTISSSGDAAKTLTSFFASSDFQGISLSKERQEYRTKDT